MNTFFEKFGKWIMVIVGVPLMVVWMWNRADTGGGGGESVLRGTLNGTKIYGGDIQNVHNSYSILRQFAGILPQANMDRRSIESTLGSLDPKDPALSMFLLLQEARQYGIASTPDEVQGMLTNCGLSPQDLNQYLSTTSLTQRELQTAISELLTINDLLNQVLPALQPSVPEMKHLAQGLQARAEIGWVALPAKAPASAPKPSANEIQKQFDLYKDVLPPSAQAGLPPKIAGHTFPFGYKYPDRVSVEYLTFDRAAIRNMLKVTPEDAENAYKYYTQNPGEFSEKHPATQAATQPAVKPFAAVRAELIGRQIDDRTDRLMKQMTDMATSEANSIWQTVNDQGYRVQQKDTKQVAYEKIADDVAQRFGYRPKYQAPGGLRDKGELSQLAGIGDAALQVPPVTMVPFADLALSVKEITDTAPEGVVMKPQAGVTGPVLDDYQQNRYVYRVTAAERTHVPATMAEVQDKVVQDLQLKASYEEQMAAAEKLTAAAKTQTLAVAAKAANLAVHTTPPFSRLSPSYVGNASLRPSPIPGLGNVPPILEATFTMAEAAPAAAHETKEPAASTQLAPDSATQPATSAPATQATSAPASMAAQAASTTQATAASDVAAGHPVTTVPVDPMLTVFVVQLQDYQPVLETQVEGFDNRSRWIEGARVESLRAFLPQWLKLEQIAQRVGYVPVHGFGKEPS